MTASTARGRQRRDAIVDAAAGLLLSGGLAAVSHRAAATAAGVPLGSTTYYFRDRDELVAAAVHRAGEVDAARARATLAASRRRSRGRETQARRLVDVVVGLERAADPVLVGALYERMVEAARHPGARAAAAGWNAAVRAVVAELLADEGVDLPAEVVLALVDGAVMAWLIDDADAVDRPGALVARVSRALASLATTG